jgi:16S rRNA (uracil1498-N3)-methyltransferase
MSSFTPALLPDRHRGGGANVAQRHSKPRQIFIGPDRRKTRNCLAAPDRDNNLMSRHRFFISALTAGPATLGPEESRHATRVLRLGPGDAIELFDGQGRIAEATIAQVARAEVRVTVGTVRVIDPPTRGCLTLLTALPRAPRQPFLFEKATELGVAEIVPLVTARSTVKPRAEAVAKFRRTCIEAAKQCGTPFLPRVASPQTFTESLTHGAAGVQRLIATTIGTPADLAQVRPPLDMSAGTALWIGPEGGFAPDEVAQAEAAGIVPVSLGPNVLRIETACLAAAAWHRLRKVQP